MLWHLLRETLKPELIYLPYMYAKGGWLLSPTTLITSFIISLTAYLSILAVRHKYKNISFLLLVRRVGGPCLETLAKICILGRQLFITALFVSIIIQNYESFISDNPDYTHDGIKILFFLVVLIPLSLCSYAIEKSKVYQVVMFLFVLSTFSHVLFISLTNWND